MRVRTMTMAWAMALALSACASVPSAPPAASASAPGVSATFQGDAARPAQASGWVRSELYFGVGREASETSANPVVDETAWRAFLDREVTPRFPDGLTVFDAYGQWLFRGNPEPNRLASKVLVILHEDTPQRDADIEAIRLAWKQATGHQSVLWSKQAVEVSF